MVNQCPWLWSVQQLEGLGHDCVLQTAGYLECHEQRLMWTQCEQHLICVWRGRGLESQGNTNRRTPLNSHTHMTRALVFAV